MRPFRYCGDPLFLLGGSAYILNRCCVKPYLHTGFFHSQFNDVWLIPCALPPILWLHRRLGLRAHNKPPQAGEIVSHLIFWCILCEWVGPMMVSNATGDFLDIVAYIAGSLLAGLWWHRERWLTSFYNYEL